MTTDTTEQGLEALIVDAMTDRGWTAGHAQDYDRDYCVDLAQLRQFLAQTQPDLPGQLDLDHDGPTRRRFLARLQGEITKRGVIDVLRNGIKHGAHELDLFYGTPSPGNDKAPKLFAPTASASRGSCATAATRRSSRSTWACSSTACRSPLSS